MTERISMPRPPIRPAESLAKEGGSPPTPAAAGGGASAKEEVGRSRGLARPGKGLAGGSAEMRRRAAAILEVLGGLRSPGEAAEAIGISLQRYYLLENQALRGLIQGCAPRPRGYVRTEADELKKLKQEYERLVREHARYVALLRASQRAMWLKEGAGGSKGGQRPGEGKGEVKRAGGAGSKGGGRGRRRRAVVRALRAAQVILDPKGRKGTDGPKLDTDGGTGTRGRSGQEIPADSGREGHV